MAPRDTYHHHSMVALSFSLLHSINAQQKREKLLSSYLIWMKQGLFSGPHAVQEASCRVRGSLGSFQKGFQESPLLPSVLLQGVSFEGGSWPGLRACQRLLKQFGVTDSNVPGLGDV